MRHGDSALSGHILLRSVGKDVFRSTLSEIEGTVNFPVMARAGNAESGRHSHPTN